MASRDLALLHPVLKPLALAFVERCKAAGIDVLITCTYRSPEEQDALYAQGRTVPGKRVTNTRGGQSKHNAQIDGRPAARAFDFVPVRAGKAVWSDKDPAWAKAGAVARSLGLAWGGDWTRFRDMPHVELPASVQ